MAKLTATAKQRGPGGRFAKGEGKAAVKAPRVRAPRAAKAKPEAAQPAPPTGQPRPGSRNITTGTAPSGQPISAEDPAQKAAEARMPHGLRRGVNNENTADRAGKGKSAKKTNSLIYRGLEILRSLTGHSKSPDYLQLEKDLGFGE